MIAALSRVLLFTLVAAFCWEIAKVQFSPAGNFVCIIGGPLAVYPTVWIARRLLDREPTQQNAKAITSVVHASIIAFYGAAVIKALVTFSAWPGWTIALPQPLNDAVFLVTTTLTSLTVINLALRSFGAPFAIALSRKLATDWLYRWTRNPIVLTSIFWFVAIGLELRSATFIVWFLFVLTPAELEYLKVYEERELEIRFGKDYLAYKARTPFLWPRRPRDQAGRGLAHNNPVT